MHQIPSPPNSVHPVSHVQQTSELVATSPAPQVVQAVLPAGAASS